MLLNLRNYTLLLFALLIFATGCEDDDDVDIPNEQEVITGVTLTLTPTDVSNDVVAFTFTDNDGDGPLPPATVTTGNLAANAAYNGSITFTNASDPMDIEDVTIEIRDEDDEHQVFYQTENGLNMTFSYADSDDDNNPVGLITNVTTGNSSSGELTITLRHEPNKEAAGISISNPDVAGGEVDIQVEFDVNF